MILSHLIFRVLLSKIILYAIIRLPTSVSGACVPFVNFNTNDDKTNRTNTTSINHFNISTSSAASASEACYFVTLNNGANYNYTYNTSLSFNFNKTSNGSSHIVGRAGGGDSSNSIKTMTSAKFGKLKLFKNTEIQKQEETLQKSSTSLSKSSSTLAKSSSTLAKSSWWSSLTSSSWWKFGKSKTPTTLTTNVEGSSKQQAQNIANENAAQNEVAAAASNHLKEGQTLVGVVTSENSIPEVFDNSAKKVTEESNAYKLNTAKFNTKESEPQLETVSGARYQTLLTVKASKATPTTKLGTNHQQTKAERSVPRPMATDHATEKPQTGVDSIISISSNNKNNGNTLTNTNNFQRPIENYPITAAPNNAENNNNNNNNNNADQNAKYNLLIEQGNIVLGVLGVVEGVVGFASGMLTTSYTTIQSTVTSYTIDPSQSTGQLVSEITSSSDNGSTNDNTNDNGTTITRTANEVWNTVTTTEVVYRTVAVS